MKENVILIFWNLKVFGLSLFLVIFYILSTDPISSSNLRFLIPKLHSVTFWKQNFLYLVSELFANHEDKCARNSSKTKNVFLTNTLWNFILPPFVVWEAPFCQKNIKILVPYSIQYWFRRGSLETSRIHVEFNRFSIESHVWHWHIQISIQGIRIQIYYAYPSCK